VQTGSVPIEGVTAIVDSRPAARRTSLRTLRRRLAGSLRLLAFVAVLATIVGTSVSLAGSNSSTTSERAPRAEPAVPVTSGTAVSEPVQTRDVETIPTPKTESSTVVPASADAVTTPSSALPVTGADDTSRWLLAGAMLVLMGMLVQIAGQPLPARVAR
jgi:hypothetical protein